MVAVIGSVKVTGFSIGKSLIVMGTTDEMDRVQPCAWSNIPDPSTQDWLGLYRPGDSNSEYLGAPRFTGATSPAGSCNFVFPADLPGGQYELRLFSNKTSHKLAQSPGFYVRYASVTGVAGIELLYSLPGPGGVPYGPSAQVHFRARTPNPSAGGDTVAAICVETGQDIAYKTLQGGLIEDYLVLPGGMTAGYHYALAYRRSTTNDVWAVTSPWSWSANNVAGAFHRVFDEIRNNGSYQRINFDLTTWKYGHLIAIRPATDYTVTLDAYYLPTQTPKGYWDCAIGTNWPPGQYQALMYDGYTQQLAIYDQPFTVTP